MINDAFCIDLYITISLLSSQIMDFRMVSVYVLLAITVSVMKHPTLSHYLQHLITLEKYVFYLA